MMKTTLALLALFSSAAAFCPSVQQRAFRSCSAPLRMSDEDSSAIVPIKEETVEFTAGVLGGVAGFLIGGPVLGAIGAAAANYASKMEGDASEVVSAVSKSSLQVYNYLARLDAKYQLLDSTKKSLEAALDKLKSSGNVDPSAIEKVETALSTTTSKIAEINDEYDLVGAGVTALGVIGDLVEKAVQKASEVNEEYKLTDKALDSLKAAIEKAKEAAQNAKA